MMLYDISHVRKRSQMKKKFVSRIFTVKLHVFSYALRDVVHGVQPDLFCSFGGIQNGPSLTITSIPGRIFLQLFYKRACHD